MRICTTAIPKTNHAITERLQCCLSTHWERVCNIGTYTWYCTWWYAWYIAWLHCTSLYCVPFFWMRIAAHIARKGDQRFGCIEQGPPTLYISNNIPNKKVKCTAGGWENKLKCSKTIRYVRGKMGVPIDQIGLPTHRGRLENELIRSPKSLAHVVLEVC